MIKKPIEIELDASHAVTNEGIHDAEITEVNLRGEGSSKVAVIHVRAENGVAYLFRLEGVCYFSMDYFGPQNIISDFLILSGTDVDDLVREIDDLEKWTLNRYSDLSVRIKSGELALIKVTPSVGCEICCVCKKVTFGTR